VEDAERRCRAFVQTWAEAVVRQVRHVRQIRDKAARQGRAYERMGPELGPDELDLARSGRQLWADEQALVWAAHQLERWTRRLALERGEDPPPGTGARLDCQVRLRVRIRGRLGVLHRGLLFG